MCILEFCLCIAVGVPDFLARFGQHITRLFQRVQDGMTDTIFIRYTTI